MGRTTVSLPYDEVGTGAAVEADRGLERRHEPGWRGFLTSWKLGALLAVGCVAGMLVILDAHPFATASISERVSDELGKPSLCAEVGAAQLGDGQATIYRCTVGLNTRGATTRCFTIAGPVIKQFSSGNRALGC